MIKRVDREISGPLNNFSEQFRFGHREVLVLYAGVSPYLAIRGSIEHGWSPFGPSVGIPRIGRGRYLNLAWSSKAMEGKSLPATVVAIGAPFLYLHKLVTQQSVKGFSQRKRKYLYLPPHGTEDASPLSQDQLQSIQELVDPKDVTVQLYWTEYLNSRVRRFYEEKGFSVDSAGFCGMSANEGLGVSTRARAMSDVGGRHLFLLNVLSNLASHDHVFAGHLSTSALYAGYMRKPITLLGDWYSHGTTYRFKKNPEVAASQPYWDYYEHLINEVVPQYFNEGNAKENFHDYCMQELGYPDMIEKSALASLLLQNSIETDNSFPVIDLARAIHDFCEA